MIGQAQTGTGKTAAFGLPLLESVDPTEHEVQALVLTPTRELCIQVTQALRAYGAPKGIDPVAVFGGAPIRTQQAQLRQGGQVVVGTVGRVLDLICRHSLVLHACRYIVLDEADEMLDLGFLEDVEKILSLAPGSRQTALFSATMPTEIRKLAERHLYDPVTVQGQGRDADDRHRRAVLPRDQGAARRPTTLARVLEAERPHQAIVFVRTKIRCEQLYRTLRDKGMNVKALHGDMSQGSRDGVMIAFKGGRVPILVATDVAARGLDISTRDPHRQLRRADLARRLRAPHRPHRPRRALGPRDHVRRAAPAARPGGDRAPRRRRRSRRGPRARTSRPSARPSEPRPRRHRKPHDAEPRPTATAYTKLIANAGAPRGRRGRRPDRRDRPRGGLDGEAIRNVRVLERFALVEVPGRRRAAIVERGRPRSSGKRRGARADPRTRGGRRCPRRR